MAQSRFPPDWDDERVQKVLAHYERQSEGEALAEDAALETPDQTLMEVPSDLVPAVRALIAKQRK
jgi:hypothetical protein